MNANKNIAQATVVVSLISPQQGFEFEVIWTQRPEMTEFLAGKFFDCDGSNLPLSKTSVGFPGTSKDVAFTPTNKPQQLEDSKTYAALIGLFEGDEVPHIICVAPYEEWKQHQLDAKNILQERATAAQRQRTERMSQEFFGKPGTGKAKQAQGKPSYHNAAKEVINDPNTYRVTLAGNSLRGSVQQVMAQACAVWQEDPTEVLRFNAEWTKRINNPGGSHSYTRCDCPEKLPPPNLIALGAGRNLTHA